MKKRFLLPIAFLMVTTLSAQPLASSSCADICQKDALITAARSVANTFGPAYVPFFKGAEISGCQGQDMERYWRTIGCDFWQWHGKKLSL